MTNNVENERTFDIPLDFLPDNRMFKMTLFEDGVNAFQQAMDYRRKEIEVKKGDVLTIRMARNGGVAAVLEE